MFRRELGHEQLGAVVLVQEAAQHRGLLVGWMRRALEKLFEMANALDMCVLKRVGGGTSIGEIEILWARSNERYGSLMRVVEGLEGWDLI